jgi:WD40 repeat protein
VIGETTVRIWNIATGEVRAGPFNHRQIVLSIDLTPDGKRLVIADKGKNVRVWDVGKGTQLLAFKLKREVDPIAAYISQAGISPDRKWYALPAEDGSVELWNLETGVLGRTIKGSEQMTLCRFSPDGARLLGAGGLGTIKMWDITTGLETMSTKLNGMYIARVRFNPDPHPRRRASAAGAAASRFTWLRDPVRIRPWRHGRCLQGAAGIA